MKKYFKKYRLLLLGVMVLSGVAYGTAHVSLSDFSKPFDYGLFLKAILLSSMVLLFLSEKVFKIWKWFALIFIPIATLIIMFPLQEPSGLLLGKKEASDIFGVLFLTITTLIIIGTYTKYFLNKRKNK